MWTAADTAANMYTLKAIGILGTAVGPKQLPSMPPRQIQVAAPQATVALLQVLLQANSTIVTKAGEAVMLVFSVVSRCA